MNIKLKRIIATVLITTSICLISLNSQSKQHKTTITDDSIYTLQDNTGQQLMTVYTDAVEIKNTNGYTCNNEGDLHIELTKDNKYIKVEYTEKTIEVISNTECKLVRKNN